MIKMNISFVYFGVPMQKILKNKNAQVLTSPWSHTFFTVQLSAQETTCGRHVATSHWPPQPSRVPPRPRAGRLRPGHVPARHWRTPERRGPRPAPTARARRDGFGSDVTIYQILFRTRIQIRILSNTNTKRIFRIRIHIRILTRFTA
jgi:hypothetical protein